MNTTEKGNELEIQVYEWLEEHLDTYGKLLKLNRHKIYHCANGRDIVVDVSIDVYASQKYMDEDRPTQTYIYECKNLNRKLEISDYDEWRGKLDDIGKTGHKLYLVCRCGFAEPIIRYAEDLHIGLIKFPYCSDIEYVLPRTIVTNNAFWQSMRSLQGEIDEDAITCYDNGMFHSFADILVDNKLPIKEKYRLDAPHLSNEYIEKVTSNIINNYTLQEDVLASMLNDSKYPLVATKDLVFDRLGYIDIPSSNIYISSALSPSEFRFRFVLAHEYGHFVLHRDILDNKIAVLYENESTIKSLSINSRVLHTLERQANRFASCLLMPKNSFKYAIAELFVKYDIHKGFMYVDKQACNLNDYHRVTNELSLRYKVSKQAAAYRMQDLGILRINEADRLLIGLQR